ncbi:MAG: hypothetical protein A3F67_07400 [Verrucomicrobia bacterium RIFCSPHIGHO2_12_FULL_41_10]|nr:MAG: hypothetical protein A3F67_07400 [Verrucomicrobia bacterium RIFCSPHIGHO2_12_FULL_41_10]HLB33116.1 hypothetical protein [Chthoniobacterales bacterium]
MKTKNISYALLLCLFLGILMQSSVQAAFWDGIVGKANQAKSIYNQSQDVIGKVNDAKNTYNRYRNNYRGNQNQNYQNQWNNNSQNSNGNLIERFLRSL